MGGDSCQAPAHVSASHTIREAGGFLRLTALEMESQRICLAVRFQDGLLRPPPGLLVVVCCPLSTYVQGTRVHDVLIKEAAGPTPTGPAHVPLRGAQPGGPAQARPRSHPGPPCRAPQGACALPSARHPSRRVPGPPVCCRPPPRTGGLSAQGLCVHARSVLSGRPAPAARPRARE